MKNIDMKLEFYIVRFGTNFLRSVADNFDYYQLELTQNVTEAKFFRNLTHAKQFSEKFGGQICKMNIDVKTA